MITTSQFHGHVHFKREDIHVNVQRADGFRIINDEGVRRLIFFFSGIDGDLYVNDQDDIDDFVRLLEILKQPVVHQITLDCR